MDAVANPLSPLNYSKNDSNSKRRSMSPRGVNSADDDNRGKKPISQDKKTPSIIRNSDAFSSASSNTSNNDEDHFSSSSLKKTVAIIHDDLSTEDDTEEDDDEILGLAHESDDVPSLLLTQDMKSKSTDNSSYKYNAYTSHGRENLYHPTSSIFESDGDNNINNKDISIGQPCLFGDRDNSPSFFSPQFSTSEESFLQDTSFYERAAFNRRPSQLQHEMLTATLNALGPPSHVLKARRLSKNPIKSSASTPVTPIKSLSTTSLSSSSIREKRKPSIVDNYSKEFSNSTNSAVSPRFMSLRKLSEVTTLPPHSISYSIVPPVPQIPSTYHNNTTADQQNNKDTTSSSTATNASATTATNKDNISVTVGNNDNENRILARIDDIIETQLQFHLGQVIWRASESHLEARKFWEEQKKEMFGFAATIVDRIELQKDLAAKITLGSLSSSSPPKSNSSSSEGNEEVEYLRKELNMYKSKSQRKSFELDMLKTRNLELEKQHEIDTISIAKQWEDKDSTLKRLHQLEQERNSPRTAATTTSDTTNRKQKYFQTKLFNLETENKQLKSQIRQMQEVNQQLLEVATTFEKNLNSRDKDVKHFKQRLMETESQIAAVDTTRMVRTESTATSTSGILDCSEDFGKKASVSSKKEVNKCIDKDSKNDTSNDTTNTNENNKQDAIKNEEASSTTTDNANNKAGGKTMENWADIMQSEDEAKKSAEEWAKKYRELQTLYFDVCLQFEQLKKEGTSMEGEKKILELGQSIAAKDEEIRHLKQAENVNHIQMNYMQLELDKYQNLIVSRSSSALSLQERNSRMQTNKSTNTNFRSKNKSQLQQQQRKSAIVTSCNVPNKNKETLGGRRRPVSLSPTPTMNNNSSNNNNKKVPPVSSEKPNKPENVTTQDGFLTFTTEINGQLSKYSIKLPTGYGKQGPLIKNINNKLNPNAITWESS